MGFCRSDAGSARFAYATLATAATGSTTSAMLPRSSSNPSQKNTMTTAMNVDAAVYSTMRMRLSAPMVSAQRSRNTLNPTPPATPPATSSPVAAKGAPCATTRQIDAPSMPSSAAGFVHLRLQNGTTRRAVSAMASASRQYA